MKNFVKKTTLIIYTLLLLIGTTLLLMLSIQSSNYAISSQNSPKTTEKVILPHGTRYKEVEYGQSFSFYDLFSIPPKDRLNLTVNISKYSLTKIGTTNITVTFEKNGSTSNGLVRLTVIDSQKPVIKTQNTTIYANNPFDALDGVTAEDNVDKDLTAKIHVNGTVDTDLAGDYTLSYTVEDSSKNITQLERIVTVLPVAEEVNHQPVLQNNVITTPPTEILEITTTNQNSTPVNETMNETPEVNTPVATNALIIAGITIPYQNGGQGAGQSIIDSNAYGTVSTWGGAPVQSSSDGMNTHFIGHNPGIFSILFSIGVGNTIVTTDSTGQTATYIVNNILRVDDYANDLSTNVNHWDLTVGTSGGERITLQTCISDTENLIVLAYK